MDPNRLNKNGHHLLVCCFNNNFKNIKIFELLLEYGANINFMKESGKCLHQICINGFDFNHLSAVQIAMKYGAKNDFKFKHWNLGLLSTVQVCNMLISPLGPANGFRTSPNPSITQSIINLLNNYSPIQISYCKTREDKLKYISEENKKLVEINRLAEIERNRLKVNVL